MSHYTNKFMLSGLTMGAALLFVCPLSAAPPTQTAVPVTTLAPAGSVMIGDFEGKVVQTKQYGTLILRHGHEFGWGWSVSTDQRAGGHSVANIALIHPGADGTHGALRITGEIKPGFPYPWAGTIWFPGHEPMQPGDLSAKQELTFWARGMPGSYSIMLKAGSLEGIPLYASFVTTSQWKEYHIPLATSFPNADLKHVFYIAFSADNPGRFQFDLDQVTLN
ncbi:MAG TPA: hypothetical protein VNI53_09910 [Gammaproteobacteria bacterium]|nr:hypothetical protein [Gammaproteobacteria bacterium]